MNTAGRIAKRDHVARLHRLARERADAQARRVPWQRLLRTRDEYIEWQEFYLWVGSVLEVENRIPDWLVEILNKRCPGFVENEKKLSVKEAKNRPLPLRLDDWIDDHTFGFAKQEGWFNAITFNAIREPRYQKAEVCWSKCVSKWKRAKPLRYPSFEEWKEMAGRCDDTARVLPEVCKMLASTHRVSAARLAVAVSEYVDWEAFAYWLRPVLEAQSPLPQVVARELELRCAGFLKTHPGTRDWQQLMGWIADHYFAYAKKEGWFNAILIRARTHPRAIRTMEYADYCDEVWGPRLPDPYPSFEQWRKDADSYVEVEGLA